MDEKGKEKYKLKKLLRELSSYSGGSTELISVYIPPKYPIFETSGKLKNEAGQASNIKSKSTRKNVGDALEKIIGYLKMFRETPKNGLIIFCGNISDNPARTDIKLFSLEPPEPINIQTYRCDSKFFLEPLQALLDIKDTYGIVVMDGREATIASVRGTNIQILKRMNSTAHAKIRKGGQCLSPDTLINLSDGRLLPVSEVCSGDMLKGAELSQFKIGDWACSDKFLAKAKKAYKITAHAPKMEIIATAWHRFFTIGENGVRETYAKDLKIGDRVLVAKKIPHEGTLQKTLFAPSYRLELPEAEFAKLRHRRAELGMPQSKVAENLGISQMAICRMERGEIPLSAPKIRELYCIYSLPFDEKPFAAPSITLPETYTPELAYLIGVIAGGGSLDKNRIIIYESKKELVEKYASYARKTLGLEASVRTVNKTGQKGSFARKAYYEIRIYSKDFADFISSKVPQIITSSEERCIPRQIQKSPLPVQSAFLSGLYDAEGYMHGKRVEIAMRSREMMRELQAMLLRFGIRASYGEKKVKGNPQWSVSISDRASLRIFEQKIGFSRSDKALQLKAAAEQDAKMQFVEQVPVDGREVFAFVKSLGLKTSDFHAASDFFRNVKPLGRDAFIRNILPVILEGAKKAGKHEYASQLLEKWLSDDIGIARIASLSPIEEERGYIDLTIPNSFNFVANGFIVHNSARRFERLIEESIEKYYKRVGEAMDTYFLSGIKGVVIGGPGPTKDFFSQAKPFNYQIKILGVVDTGYVDEYGVREVLTKSEGILLEQELLTEKKLVDSFIREVARGGLAIYGEKDVRQAIESKAASMLLVSEALSYIRATFANNAGEIKSINAKSEGELEEKGKEQNSQGFKLSGQKPLLDDLIELAENNMIEVKIISNDTTEGAQFYQSFYGIGAFIRYRIS